MVRSKWLIEALESAGYDVEYIPNHLAPTKFPFTVEDLQEYDGVILSDIGSNTLLLNDDVFIKGIVPDRLQVIRDYVSWAAVSAWLAVICPLQALMLRQGIIRPLLQIYAG